MCQRGSVKKRFYIYYETEEVIILKFISYIGNVKRREVLSIWQNAYSPPQFTLPLEKFPRVDHTRSSTLERISAKGNLFKSKLQQHVHDATKSYSYYLGGNICSQFDAILSLPSYRLRIIWHVREARLRTR